MRLAAVTMVRSECDIIESFVRHNAAFFDRLYILDHRSTDTTSDILRKLAEEGLPLVLSREDYGIFYQAPNMTHLIKRAFDDYPWDFIVPLDCDEFLRIRDRAAFESALADLDGESIGLSDIINYVPTEIDDFSEIDALRRIVHRAKTIPDASCKIGKVIIPGAVIQQPGFSLNEGHHGVCIDGQQVPERRLEGLSLAHFPVRSIDQFILRTILCRLAWTARSDYDPSWGWHYGTFFKQLQVKPAVSAADLTAAALLYADIYTQPGQIPHQKVLVRDPVTPTYEQLRYTNLIDIAALPPVLDMMDFLLGELRAARMASAAFTLPTAAESETSDTVLNRLEARTITHENRPAEHENRFAEHGNRPAQHRFQSFWHGEALSPYELFCLKSFIDCGYAVDLYTYDADLVVPAGVRVCDAARLVDRDEVFVYQAEGFGKGSPSAFSNFFRYKLLAEKGGWWIDTDVVCLTDRIPAFTDFFARQDTDFVACGTMYFEPRHPVMLRCLEQAMKLGHAVKWGDTGPRLLTRVLGELGYLDRAVPAAACYPIHYSQALDLLRPSKTAVLAPKAESALFLHVWNSMLVHRGVHKAFRPPKGSLLRKWTDKHPVEGWIGEYDERTLEHGLNLKSQLDAAAAEKAQLLDASAAEKAQLQAALELQAAENERERERERERFTAELNAQIEEKNGLQAALELRARENEQSQTQIDAMLSSTSWRLTAPLRAGGQRFPALRFLGRRR